MATASRSIASTSWSNFETTTQELAPEEVVEVLAGLAHCRPTLSRLRRLTLASYDTRFLGALLYLVSTPEAQEILSDWAPENRHAAGLARLGRTCWGEQQAVAALRPFKEDRRVATEFGKKVELQYLAAMAASRRALPSDQTSAWIQRLRLYILARAMDALEAGAVREGHLLQICRTIRSACETTGHQSWQVLEAVAGSSSGFQGFVAEASVRCRAALQDRNNNTGRTFYQQLLYVLEDKGWKALPGDNPVPDASPLEPYASSTYANALAGLNAFRQSTSNSFQNFHSPLQGGNFVAGRHRTSQKHSPKNQVRHGNGLRLEHIERSLFLPHSWLQLSKLEESTLLEQTREFLTSPDLANQFGASCTLIALLCSQSMHDVATLSLDPAGAEHWCLDLANNQLVRKAPRFGRRWRHEKAATDATAWLHRLAEQWVIELDPIVCKPIGLAISRAPKATTLGELWMAVGNDQTLAIWFNKQLTCHPALARVTSPCLVNPGATHVFQQSSDQALARLVSSDSRTALPSACAYAAYRAPRIHESLGVFVKSKLAELIAPTLDTELNAAGSEMDIRLNLLRQAIGTLTKRVTDAANSDSWVKHHNLLTSLTVLSLLASTGARPVNSPFESVVWIDFTQGLIYIEDKSSGPTQGSRVCVLSDYARALLEKYYLPHLHKLADAFRQKDPVFAAEIDALFEPDAQTTLPLFFFMRERPGIDWFEVSESELERVCQFDWPLPWNLFRHLTSTWLCRWGLHPDIRDALLGHAERDAEPHGYFSPRIPADDLEQARPFVNRLTLEAGFVMPGDWCLPEIADDLALSRSNPGYTRLFGRKARALKRQQTLESARNLALTVIKSKLGDRSVDQLSPDEIDEIATSMLFREDGLPHVMGSIRYQVFETFLAEQWSNHGKRAKVNRRYVVILEGRQLFNETVIQAETKLAQFGQVFETFVATRSTMNEPPVLAATMAAVDLVLTSKVTNFQALCALLCNHYSIKLVHFDGKYWFEWAYGAVWKDGKPVFRVEVTQRAAHWISQVSRSRTLTAVPPVPSAMVATFRALEGGSTNLGRSIRQLAELQTQVNALKMAGIDAGYLCGARPSAALPHADWIRLVKGAAPLVPTSSTLAVSSRDTDELEAAEHFFRHHHRRPPDANGAAIDRCKVMFKAVYDGLKSTDPNQKIATKISLAAQASGFARGDAPFLLAHFAVHLLKRKPKKGTRDRLRSVTALRYWESLAPMFLNIAADTNLVDAEEDDLTDLYDQLIKASDTAAAGESEEASTGAQTSGGFSNLTDAPLRALTQLKDFHEFARATYGLDDPDWSEISPDISIGVGRPGIILEAEYLAILHSMLGGKSPDALSQAELRDVFVLVVCARFGLRIGEAVGLHRCDWIDFADTLIVLVRSNPTRTLKTIRSKRKVPKLEKLTEPELAVINSMLGSWIHREGKDLKTPLLPGVSRATFKAVKSEIGSRLLQAIKRVTGNEASTVHMLRHGFAMRILALLWCRQLDASHPVEAQASEHARRLLTGTPDVDKRLLWAVSRLLGHASPGVTLKSYVNCLHIWMAPLTALGDVPELLIPTHAVDLDQFTLSHDYLQMQPTAEPPEVAQTDPAFLRCMRAVRLIGIGQNETEAYRHSQLSPAQGTQLISDLTKAAARLARTQNRYGIYNLLQGITPVRMNELVALVESAAVFESRPSAMVEWELTVGASRQILLFEAAHFELIATFCTQFGFTKADIWLVSKDSMAPSYASLVTMNKLTDFVRPKSALAKTFQLDVARSGDPPRSWPDRLAAIPAGDGTLKSTFELLLLWVVWNIALQFQ